MANERTSSGTARGVAMLRAAHQIVDDDPPILHDPVIVRLLGPDIEALVREHREALQSPPSRALRSHVVLRSRFAEDSLGAAVARGAGRYVLLGAGLDTFAYRQPEWANAIEIVEVDHPASQRDKREALTRAGIPLPQNLRFADVDFEHETLAAGLARAGVGTDRVTFFSWLGVTMYLTLPAIEAVLDTVAGFAAGSAIVLTFAQPVQSEEDHGVARLAEGAAAMGEPWVSYFTPDEMTRLLSRHGFADVQFPSRDDLLARYFANRRDGLSPPRRNSICTAVVGSFGHGTESGA